MWLPIQTVMLQRRNYFFSYVLQSNKQNSRNCATGILPSVPFPASYHWQKSQEEQNTWLYWWNQQGENFASMDPLMKVKTKFRVPRVVSLPSIDPPLTPLSCRSVESKEKKLSSSIHGNRKRRNVKESGDASTLNTVGLLSSSCHLFFYKRFPKPQPI